MECPLCDRETPDEYLEKHHLLPKCKKGRVKVKMCIDCHRQIHQLFLAKDLVKFASVEKLKSDPRILQFLDWIRTKKRFGMCMARKKRR